MESAAFFDLDRTVVSGASTFYFGKAALSHGYYSRGQLVRDAWKAFWFRRRGDAGTDSEAVRDHILSAVKGWRRSDMDSLMPDVIAPVLARLYPESHERILEHERAGVATYLCSASPVEIVGPIADVLKMSGGALSTVAAIDSDGRYTGKLEGPFCYGKGKADAILIEAQSSGIDLDESYAYSDSSSDIPMLEVVGHPVAVNPDRELRRVADDRGWEIVRFEPRHGLRLLIGASAVGAVAVATGVLLGVRALRRSTVLKTAEEAIGLRR